MIQAMDGLYNKAISAYWRMDTLLPFSCLYVNQPLIPSLAVIVALQPLPPQRLWDNIIYGYKNRLKSIRYILRQSNIHPMQQQQHQLQCESEKKLLRNHTHSIETMIQLHTAVSPEEINRIQSLLRCHSCCLSMYEPQQESQQPALQKYTPKIAKTLQHRNLIETCS